MSDGLSANTQAILLLTAPLMLGNNPVSRDLLRPSEYKKLALHLRHASLKPADFLSPDASYVVESCAHIVDPHRLERLLSRGFLLSQVLDYWGARSIWVVSRADPSYPKLLKARMREDAPAVLYGCGEISLLDMGGLAVVGSRKVDDGLVDYASSVGRLAARAGRAIISGGAKGVDSAAMDGALSAGGTGCEVLAENLDKAALSRKHRDALMSGRLTLISPFDPSSIFSIGRALSRNKFIYALADIALVVNSDMEKGGTWAGAVEQIDKLKFVSVFVRSTGPKTPALEELLKKGAFPWPNPIDDTQMSDLFQSNIGNDENLKSSKISSLKQSTDMFSNEDKRSSNLLESSLESSPQLYPSTELNHRATLNDDKPETISQTADSRNATRQDDSFSETDLARILFASVSELIQRILAQPKKAADVALELQVSVTQVQCWLDKLVEQGIVEKAKKPVMYRLKSSTLFDKVDS